MKHISKIKSAYFVYVKQMEKQNNKLTRTFSLLQFCIEKTVLY